ncbi:MAG: agmatinase [Spirochaetales bacterium]|nr:agmatinase [Spirochaetales bacterium]|tara:strand:+ start:3736 stop:4620 length:885 start_codon:yes stop_codon:yes gene_type:complete
MEYLISGQGFLGIRNPSIKDTHVIVVPYGLENTVSYGKGTANGPREIIKASHQVELYDEELGYEPYNTVGIRTIKAKKVPQNNTEALKLLGETVDEISELGKFPFILGGEHTITAGSIQPFAKKFDKLTVVHFDAHADLRNSYEGRRLSHACTIRRCLDYKNVNIVSIGIRNISREEAGFAKKNKERVRIFWAKDKIDSQLKEIVKQIKDNNVYISFDLDVFDSSLMAATGTPEPGGLFWNEAIETIKAVTLNSNILGADITELAPIKGLHSYNFLAARLCYKIISYIFHYNRS